MPNQFKVEFDIKPTSRSGSGIGSSSYLRIGNTSNDGIWVGQGTSGGRHGIIPRPSGDWVDCPTYTVLSTDNHITVTYDGTTVSYNCNNETVTYNISSLTTKINGVIPTSNNHLKNIKIKPL